MSSYVEQLSTGKFKVWVGIQDGTEPCGEYDTEEEAREEFVKAEEVLNHRKCKPEDAEVHYWNVRTRFVKTAKINKKEIKAKSTGKIIELNFTQGTKVRHFKGGEYEIVGLAEHTTTGEKLVVYKGVSHNKGKLWVRPYSEFTEEVKIPRFAMI